MPSSSRARRRSESVRGLIPSSDRSSSQNRALPSARSRISSSVHFPQTTSAVLQTGQVELLSALMIRSEDQWHLPRFNKCSAKASQTEVLVKGRCAQECPVTIGSALIRLTL